MSLWFYFFLYLQFSHLSESWGKNSKLKNPTVLNFHSWFALITTSVMTDWILSRISLLKNFSYLVPPMNLNKKPGMPFWQFTNHLSSNRERHRTSERNICSTIVAACRKMWPWLCNTLTAQFVNCLVKSGLKLCYPLLNCVKFLNTLELLGWAHLLWQKDYL